MSFFICCGLIGMPAGAYPDTPQPDTNEFITAITRAQENCTGILDKLTDLQKMAGINTVVTGVGTLAAGGALWAGISKHQIDKQAEELSNQLADIENMSDADFIRFLKDQAAYMEALEQYQNICHEKKSLEAKSKKLGNIRTGLMAGNTATAIAGTIIANKNKNNALPVAEHVEKCLGTMNQLSHAMGQARITAPEYYEQLNNIYTKCSKFYTKNLDKIHNNSKAAMISSAVNIGTGTVGTITSAAANTNATRNDNSESGKKKEKNLNTAANVFAGLSTAASGVSTVFNAMTLKAINDNKNTAQECEEALY